MIELTDANTGQKFYLNAWFVLELRQGESNNSVLMSLDTGGFRQVVGTVDAISALINKVIQA